MTKKQQRYGCTNPLAWRMAAGPPAKAGQFDPNVALRITPDRPVFVGSLAALARTQCILCTWVPVGPGWRLKYRSAACDAMRTGGHG